ncbi:ArsC/Spx/MgsR family protein [Falsihalocynthiibacter sp. SS001]|uniref:ArsC/Spx/MgsR family protein n=1 Tax=Falsihalocynthiibacter sp. SS001 TaxID=3349698 RepID=UPI0036D22266
MKIWGLKACDTCRKANKAIAAQGVELESIDVRADGVATDDLNRFYDAFGEALVNRRSTTWRGLSEDERAGDPIELLREHPTLMKRPVIEHQGTLYLGWGADVQAAILD